MSTSRTCQIIKFSSTIQIYLCMTSESLSQQCGFSLSVFPFAWKPVFVHELPLDNLGPGYYT